MAFVTVLGVFGSNGTENKTDKFQKLFYDGLVTALGIYASDVDAVVATSAPAPALTKTKKYGTALIHPLSSGTPLRALFQPELHQFQTAFEEAVAEAVDAVGSGVAVVVVVYAGEVLHSTGEWLLADTTFSGEQLQMWLDSSAAAAWQPDIQKLTTAPSGTEPINIVVCTPSAGAKTRWPMAAIPGGSTQLVMLSKSRRLPVHLQTMASWRANGKLPAAPSNATAFEALHALSGELARLHWEHQLKLLAEAEQEFTLAQRSFKHAPPALYLLPSGHGGVQTQACGLFVVQGVNVLLGSAFAEHKPPQWWQLVRSLDRLDTAIFPDWSAASIQSYRFLTKHLLYATSASYSANWLGCLFTPAPIEPGVESPLLLTPPTTATTTADPHRLRYLSAQPEQTRLFYKIGVGELSLKYLGASVGVLLVWHPAPGEGKAKIASPLTIFLPVVHSPEASVSPASLLAGLVRMLRKAPETNVEGANAITTATPTKRTTLASTAAKSPGVASRTVNSTPPMKTHVNGTLRNSTSASTKPLASKSTPTRTLLSRTPMTRPVAPSRTVSSTTPRTKTTTTTPRPATSTTRPTTTTITTPRDRAAHPTTTRPSTMGIKAKITPLSKKSPDEKRPTPTSKTEVKLVEHAAKVAKATAEKTGHEIKYAPSGRPSNLPPRRKVGEKTVMEELNELPEVMKIPATDSLAEVVKQQQQGQETEEEVSYPDSLHAEETETKEAAMTPNKAEPAKYVVSVEHHEVPEAEPVPASHEETLKSPASLDFAVPAVTDNHDVITSKADDPKSPMGAGLGVEQHQEDLGVSSGSPIESIIGKSPAGMDLAMSSACAEHHEDLEMEVSTSSVDKGLVFDSGADEHHKEFVMSKSLAAMVTLKSPTEMEFTMPPGVDENHEDLHAHEVGSKPPFHEEVFEPKSSFHDEISRSSAGMKFEMPPGFYEHHEDAEILKSPADIRVSTFSVDTHLTKQSGPKHHEEFRVLHSSGSKSECPIHEEILKSPTDVGFAMPADVKVSTSPADVEYGVHHDGEHEEDLEESRSALHEEISKSPTDVGFAMPADVKVSTSPTDVEYGVHHDGEHEEDLEESRSALHEEISKSPTDVGFAMPADVKVSTSPTDVEYGVHHDGEHEEDLEESRSALHEEISKSPTDVGFAMPADVKVSTSPADVEYGVYHDGEHEEDLEESRSALHEEISKSPTDVGFAMPADVKVSTSPADVEYGVHHDGEHEEDLEESRSALHEEISKSPTDVGFAMPADVKVSTSPADVEYGVHHDGEHEEDLEESRSALHEEISKSPTDVGFAMPADVKVSTSPTDVEYGVHHDGEHEEDLEESRSALHEEISKSPTDVGFAMPADVKVSTSPTDVEYGVHHDGEHEEDLEESRSALHEEISKSPTDVGFAMPADVKVSTSPTDVEYGVHHDGEHEEDLEESRSALHEEISKSPTDVGFAMPADVKVSTSPTDVEYGVHHDGEHEEDLEESRSALHEEISKSPTDVGFAMPADVKVSTSPTDVEYGVHHDGEHEEDLEESRSALHEEISKSPTDVGFAMPADVKVSTSPADVEYGVYHDGEHEEDLEESRSALHEESSQSSVGMELGVQHEFHDTSGLPRSPDEAQFALSPDTDAHKDVEIAQSPVIVDFDNAKKHQPVESYISRSQAHFEREISKSPAGMEFAVPSGDATCCEVVDASKASIAASTLLSRSPELDGSLKSNFPPSSLGDHTMEVTKFQEQSHAQPQKATTDDEFPVHEISVGGGKVIPEVTDHIDSMESTPENMPPIHGDLMYQLQTECTSQPADSTTYDGPHIGFMDVAAGRPVDENIHTPSSEASNGSMIHTESAPIPPGFKPEVVSSSSPTIKVASPQSGAPSGFSSQHPLLYSQHQSESFEGEEEAEASLHKKFPTAAVGGTGDMEVPSCKEAESSEKPVGSSDSSGAGFDPLTQWGHPQGIPVPVLPSRTILVRPSRPTTARSAALGTKAPASSTTSKVPETLSPGSPLRLDVIWVPGYIIRVPFAMATQFFTQVRARVYVLSGECLHPITGEALIAGISKWKPEEREAVTKMSGGRGVEGINVVPTDEPLEWVRWLRRSSGGSGDGSGTGEERLQAVGVTVHSSATLSDIHFSDHRIEITCPGTQLPV